VHDLQLASRALRATPIVSSVAILSLALCIGANTAIFSIINGLLLRTLPVAEPQRLVTVSSASAIDHGFRAGLGWSYPMWERLRQRAQAFDGAFAWYLQRFDLGEGGEMQPVDGLFASGDFFTTLGVPALLGRTFTNADDVRGGGPKGPVAVISYRLWQRRLGAMTDIAGKQIVIEGVPFTIVGVTPPDFFGIDVGHAFDVALPLGTEPLVHPTRPLLDNPRSLLLAVMLRLRPDQSLAAATATLQTMQPEIVGTITAQTPPFLKEPYLLAPAATGTADRLRQQYEQPILALSVLVGLVLVVACVNIANLLSARAIARRHELSVRLALGASRWRLARQLLVESLVLAGLGAALGLLLAAWASQALVAQLPSAGAPVFLNLSFDWRVLAFTAAVAVGAVVLFGTAPAFRVSHVAPIGALSEQGRSEAGHARLRVSGSLVIAQVALSLVLVVAAGLFVRTFERLARLPLGFDPDRVLLINVETGRLRADPAQRTFFYDQLVGTVAAVPGVANAAASLWTPAGGGGFGLLSDARGRAVDAERRVVGNFITPGWFATYGIPIRAGRDLDAGDTAISLPVVVVNEAFARKFLPGRSAIGETFDATISQLLAKRTAVGVVGDAPYGSLRDAVPPTIYLPLAQSVALGPPGRTSVVISARSTAGSPASLAPSVAAALRSVNRDLAFTFRPLASQVSASFAQERLVALLAASLGALALLLAGLGLYGLTAYAVSRRRAEIGVRLALGAAPSGVVRLVLARVALLVGVGIGGGIAASMWLSQFVAPLLYGLQPRDPVTLVAAAATLAAIGALAGWFPAARASRVDPSEVLRNN
jgi:putative ABC transport system permease protein